MTKRVNMHIHTAYSDGESDIAEVIKLLSENAVDFFAITDHDNIKSADFLSEYADKMKFINGVELTGYVDFDTTCLTRNHSLHILAYDFDTESMNNYLKRWDEQRKLALRQYVQNKKVEGNVFTECNSRTALAKELLSRGCVSTFMEGVLLINKETNYQVCVPTLKNVLEAIKVSGGLSVWAHPLECLNYNIKTALIPDDIELLLNELINYGLDGIEADYYPYNEQQKADLKSLAAKYNLLYSCGTDYHAREGDMLFADCDLTNGSLIDFLQNRIHPEFILLDGGRSTENVKRKNNLVYRSVKSQSGQTIQFLNFLESKDFAYSPKYIKRENGFDVFTYIKGYVPEDIGRTTQKQLDEFMRIIKKLHDLSSLFTKDNKVICHNDLSPCNTVFANEIPIGIIDWDSISSGERWEDLAYITWLWLNLGSRHKSETDLVLCMAQALNAYDADDETISDFAEKLIWRMRKVLIEMPPSSNQYPRTKEWVDFSKEWVDINKNKIKNIIG